MNLRAAGSRLWRGCWVLGALVAARPVAGALPPAAASGMPASSAAGAAPGRAHTLLSRTDLWYGFASGAAIVTAAFNDRWLTEETTEARSAGEHRLARLAQPLGNLALAGPALVAVYGAGRFTGHPELGRSAVRIGLCMSTAAASTLVLKQCVGRARPDQSPEETWSLRPFSGHASFPSGHTALAFATATAVTVEAPARWIPWMAYPVAALVGWSRVHDKEHWTSDVVAGAALGTWTAFKTEAMLRDRDARPSRWGLFVWPSDRATLAGVRADW